VYNDRLVQAVREKFGDEAKIIKVYPAFENGETRAIIKITETEPEQRYIVNDDGDFITLEHRI
jgi:hypothetical protein